ncbi:MAG: hypothetical protein ACYC8T_21710, partial [Myxococcaceae bacterium]
MRRALCWVWLAIPFSGCEQNLAVRNALASIVAEPPSVDFGTTAPGVPVEREVTLFNEGRAALQIEEVLLDGVAADSFSMKPLAATALQSGERVVVGLVYSPKAEGNHGARLLVRSNANNARELAVSLSGVAFSADPCAKVSCNQPPGPCFRE